MGAVFGAALAAGPVALRDSCVQAAENSHVKVPLLPVHRSNPVYIVAGLLPLYLFTSACPLHFRHCRLDAWGAVTEKIIQQLTVYFI